MTFLRRTYPTRTNQGKELFDFRNDFFGAFDDFFNLAPGEGSSFVPTMSIRENKDAYFIEAELPGIPKEAIDISLKENILTLKGEKKLEKTEDHGNYHTEERRFGSFTRSVRMPSDIDSDKVNAQFRDGVLTVEVGKADEEKGIRKISIQ